jgi:sugar/nucleoside kinase (ribokinase family)
MAITRLPLVEGKNIEAAARFACVAASLKCTRFGGRLSCPTRAEVGAFPAGDQRVAPDDL